MERTQKNIKLNKKPHKPESRAQKKAKVMPNLKVTLENRETERKPHKAETPKKPTIKARQLTPQVATMRRGGG